MHRLDQLIEEMDEITEEDVQELLSELSEEEKDSWIVKIIMEIHSGESMDDSDDYDESELS